MSRAFVSYVKEDAYLIKYITEIFDLNKVPYWLDKNDIDPGLRWKAAIRQAIESGNFYIAMFSHNWQNRNISYANEELTLAIEQLRLRPRNRAWFIPVKLDDCEIPDWDIGGGETLRSLQYIDVANEGWQTSLGKLLRTLGVQSPALDAGEPLGAGLPSSVKIVRGRLIVEKTTPPVPNLIGAVFSFVGGWLTRTENHTLAYLHTQAPYEDFQAFNEQFGLASFYAVSTDPYVSTDPARPSSFSYSSVHEFPAGTSFIADLNTRQRMSLPIPVKATVSFAGLATISANNFVGTYAASYDVSLGGRTINAVVSGRFDVDINPEHDPTPIAART